MKCLDTYALCELSNGNKNFLSYLQKPFVITELTLVEFYDILFRNHGTSAAQTWINQLAPYTQSATLSVFIDAIIFKRAHAKRNISFFDAVGYQFSQAHNCLFVTGDKEFEHLPGVEFVKK